MGGEGRRAYVVEEVDKADERTRISKYGRPHKKSNIAKLQSVVKPKLPCLNKTHVA